jgi:hypothetical protein
MLKMFGLSLALAFFAESFVEYLLGTPIDKLADTWPQLKWVLILKKMRWALMYVAAGAGLYFAHYFKIDLFFELTNGVTGLGIVLTGLGIGRGADWLHSFYSQFLRKKPDIPG